MIENLKEHLGEDWLRSQMNSSEYRQFPEIGLKVLSKIGDIIKKLEHIKGFGKWVNEAKTSLSFKDYCLTILPKIRIKE